jgi:diadenosine tetraphosphate (Ap4A) HIT family hydrolase
MKGMATNCDHCTGGLGLKHPLFEDDHFWVVADIHPITEGHILIITKQHEACMGALDKTRFAVFERVYEKVISFLNETYGIAAAFEHGIVGQSVFHAHTHFLPLNKPPCEIVPEMDSIRAIRKLADLRTEFNENGKYLFFASNDDKFLVDTKIGQPMFFRNRISSVLGAKERGNAQATEDNKELMKTFGTEIRNLEEKWNNCFNIKKESQ